MNLQKQFQWRESLKKIYGNMNDADDAMDALIALIAKERDEYEEKIETMDKHYQELLTEYRQAVDMWRKQAECAMRMAGVRVEQANEKITLND